MHTYSSPIYIVIWLGVMVWIFTIRSSYPAFLPFGMETYRNRSRTLTFTFVKTKNIIWCKYLYWHLVAIGIWISHTWLAHTRSSSGNNVGTSTIPIPSTSYFTSYTRYIRNEKQWENGTQSKIYSIGTQYIGRYLLVLSAKIIIKQKSEYSW